MPQIGMAMLEKTGSLFNRVMDKILTEHRPDRLIAGAKPLGNCDDIGDDVFRFTGEQSAGSSHAAHHLIQNDKHAIAVTNFPDAGEIARHRRHRASRRAHHRFSQKGHHIFRANTQNFSFQFIGDTSAIGLGTLTLLLITIGVTGGNQACFDKQWFKLAAAPLVAPGGQRPQCVAMIALPPGNYPVPRWLANFDKILPCQFDRGFHRF